MKKRIVILLSVLALVISSFSILVMSVGAATPTPELSIPYCNLSFKNNVGIKYAVKSNVEGVKLLVWTAPETEYVVGTQDDEITTCYEDTINSESYLIFDYTKLTAKQMGDAVYTRAYVKVNGVDYYSEINKYSILQYAYNMLGKTDVASTNAELKDMLTQMLEYGAAAQKYLDDYKANRLVTADWYQVAVAEGVLDDGCTNGLYLPGDKVTMIAPVTNAEGATFSHWATRSGVKVGTTARYELTVGSKNELYVPVYVKYSSGLEFDSNGDGTCYIVGMGDCSDTELVIPPTSPDGDKVIGIDSSAFAGEALTSVSFPNTIEEIGRRAFNNCSSLTDVYYDGTEEEWNNKVSISSGNDAIVNATKHFNQPAVETFTVTFVDYDGTVLKTEIVESGKNATPPADPTREGYEFKAWSGSYTNVTANQTVTAEYEINITGPSVVVNSVTANINDETVDVVISIANNPGISSLKFDVTYDDCIELTNITFDSAFGAYVTSPQPYGNPQTITCISPLNEVTANGTFATLTFDISNVASVETVADIIVTLHQNEIYDEDFNAVVFEAINGSITVK